MKTSEPKRYSPITLLGLLYEARYAIVLIPLAAAILAVGLTVLRGRDWVADATLRPQVEGSELSQIAGLASQFGLNLGSMGEGESIEFYARLTESRGLLERIAQSEFRFVSEPGSSDTIAGTPIELFEIEEDTREETIREAVDELREAITVSVDDGAGVFSIATRTRWSGFAEALNAAIIDAITRFNVETRQTRARAEREFAERQAAEARAALTAAEDALTQFMERNRRFQDPALSVEEDRLRRQVTMQQQVYTALVQSFEQARLEEVRSTPTITVIDTPDGSATRQGSLIRSALVAAMLGLTLVLLYLFLREYAKEQTEAHPGDVEALRSRMRRGRAGNAALALLLLLPASAAGQESDAPRFASGTLPASHWAVRAARKLDALGLVVSSIDRSLRTMSSGQAGLAIREGAHAARPGTAEAAMAEAYRDRFAEEFGPVVARLEGHAAAHGHVALGAAYQHRDGALRLAGAPTEEPFPVHEEEGARERAQLIGELGLYAGSHLALAGSRRLSARGEVIEQVELVGRLGPTEVWLGQHAPGYGPGQGGGVVLNGTAALPGGGFRLSEPLGLPGFLNAIGRVGFDTFLTRLDRNSDVRHPWLWGMRASLRPHERVGLGVQRAAMFGGEGNGDLDMQNLFYLLIGKHGSGGSAFDNQVVAVDAWWRVPASAPITVYAEWGFEDSAGAFRDVPGVLIGGELAALPGVPTASAGVELTFFDESCCASPSWYRHMRFHDGWTASMQPLGHPLGGHGREWRVYSGVDALNARLRVSVAGFMRERGFENIEAPNREGDSAGFEGTVAWQIVRHVDAEVAGYMENGDGWTETHLGAGARAYF